VPREWLVDEREDVMSASTIQLPADGSGKHLRTNNRGGTTGHDQYIIPTDERLLSFRGRCATFRVLGRAGTAGQKLFAIHNATASAVIVDVKRIKVDLVSTAVRAITVEPSLIRLWKFTAVPTNGNAVTKVSKNSALYPSSSASVTLWQDSSADRTASATTLTITLPAATVLSQEYGSRNFTAVGQEAADKISFLEDEDDVVTLNALEGVCVFLDYATATFNPTTDIWVVSCDWDEYTRP
jgi:hypothetical protein